MNGQLKYFVRTDADEQRIPKPRTHQLVDHSFFEQCRAGQYSLVEDLFKNRENTALMVRYLQMFRRRNDNVRSEVDVNPVNFAVCLWPFISKFVKKY